MTAGQPSAETILFGRHPVLEALEAGEPLLRVLVAEGADRRGTLGRLLGLARDAGVPAQFVPRAALDRAVAGVGHARHQGVVAYMGGYRYRDLNEILAVAIRRDEAPLLLVLDAVQDVHNLGALLRAGEAAGIHGALLSDRHGAGITAAVRKASAGAVAHLAVARVDLASGLDELRARGITVVGLAADGPGRYDEVDLTGPTALVVGGEQRGLAAAVARRCDALVHLPMRGRVASLNAAVAGSIALYEAVRQRSSPRPDGLPVL